MRTPVFADADVILDFLEIKQTRLLVQLYREICVIEPVDGQIQSNRSDFEIWREEFPIIYPEPEWYMILADMKIKFGLGAGEVDRMAAITAFKSGGILLTRDNELKTEAIDFLGMNPKSFVGSVEILCECVTKGFISKKDALTFCDDISEARCHREDLDKVLIEDLPD